MRPQRGKTSPFGSVGIGKGGYDGRPPRLIRPGQLDSATEANLYFCMEKGGHLIDQNPCPYHHTPTTRYRAE